MWNPMQADEALGLEKEGETLRGAFIRYVKSQPQIQKLFSERVDSTRKEPLAALQESPFSKSMLSRIMIVTGISPEETLIRPLEIKLTKQADIDTVLAFQAEPLLPYPIEQAYLGRWILGKTEDTTQVSVLAVHKEFVKDHITWYQEHVQIDPERISTVSSALALFANWYAPVQGLMLILHLGRENGCLLLAEEGKVLAAQGLPLTFSSLGSPSGQAPAESASQATLEALRQWLIRTVFAFTKQVKGRDIPYLLCTGEGATRLELVTMISGWLDKDLIDLKPVEKPKQYDHETLLTYAVPIGLACGAFPDNRSGDLIQLRQGEDIYKNPWKRLKQPFIAFTAACLLCAFALYSWNAAGLKTRQHALKTEYGELLVALSRDPREVEAQISDHGGVKPSDDCISLQHLTPSLIKRRLALLEKENAQVPSSFPLQPNILRVSDLLAYLSTHPKAVELKDGQKIPLFQVTSLNYQMTKRPDRNKSNEHYQVKVDLELQSSDSKGPRELYDALLEPNEVVDPDNPVTWAAGQGKYRITFYLKDHTSYP